MRHFSAEKWSDFVRGVTPPRERVGMQAHLDSGCSECRDTVVWLEQLVEAAAPDRMKDPPSEMVKRAQAIFGLPEARDSQKDWMERLEDLAAELIFDSRSNLQPAGVRSVESGHVRLLYRAGDYSVDLQMEPFEASPELVGQIGAEGRPASDLAEAVVQIVAGGRTLAETQTNQFGEFIIEQPRNRHAILRILLKHCAKRIDLPLQNRIQLADPS